MSANNRTWYAKVLFCAALLLLITGITVYWKGRQQFAWRTHCVGNLVHLKVAKNLCRVEMGLKDGDTIPRGEFEQRLFKPFLQYRCPNGGMYVVNVVGVNPQCTYTNACHTYSFDGFKPIRRKWYHSLASQRL